VNFGTKIIKISQGYMRSSLGEPAIINVDRVMHIRNKKVT